MARPAEMWTAKPSTVLQNRASCHIATAIASAIDHQIIMSYHHQISTSSFSHSLRLTLGDVYANQVPRIIKMSTNGVHMAPFGKNLCQNIAPRLRIISQAFLALKIKLNNSEKPRDTEGVRGRPRPRF